jgi:ABC-type uncharacterized transport system permease subunit
VSDRFRAQLEEAVLPAVIALLIAIVCGDLLIISYGQAPGPVYRMLLEGTWGNWYGSSAFWRRALPAAASPRFRPSSRRNSARTK